MELNNLIKLRGYKKPAKRVGRGGGSGKGWHTSGRGQKGQKARVGYNIPIGFEGGQVPLHKRFPILTRFKSKRGKQIFTINLSVLNRFDEGQEVSPQTLVEKRLLRKLPRNGVKILGSGELKKKLTLKGFLLSASAKEKLEKSGSTFAPREGDNVQDL
ncbi:MAG TPA: 50S ribosomal protein L15 [Candidatus Saccharimonadales bacterium]|nr:50S ribosomal protein L15 [Candidatus Saccharimonadales bacterium]